MRVPRAHFAGPLASGRRVELPEATAHHCLRVLRLRDGATVRLFNGEPGDWLARLVVHGKSSAAAEVDGFEPRASESPLAVTLVQGISRGQRMDYTLEKSVELGIGTIVPVFMDRTQAPPRGERVEKKTRHWRGVVEAAAAQSGRTRLPDVASPVTFGAWIASAEPGDRPHLLLDPEADRGAAGLGTPAALTLIAGPEGGFSPQERSAALAAGCRGMRLGPRVLRTETAAVAALSLLQGLYGDIG